MKELSIEEKAKAYDKAIKVAADIKAGIATYITDGTPVIDAIFPQLKESEDEKIRKELIRAFNSLNTLETWNGIKRTDILTWLEKQGEHANFRNKIQIGDKVTRNEAGILVNISQLNRVAKPAKRQGGQKLADKVEPRQEELTKFEKAVKQVMEEAIECGDTNNLKADADMLLRLVQSHSWSEEDKDILFRTINDLKFLRDTISIDPKYAVNIIDKEREINWLKSIKNRVQTKQEWSEMDENIISEVIQNYESGFLPSVIERDRIVKALKSLKQKIGWKPSDEQVKVCKEVYADLLSAKGFDLGTINSELNRLEEELKKLK